MLAASVTNAAGLIVHRMVLFTVAVPSRARSPPMIPVCTRPATLFVLGFLSFLEHEYAFLIILHAHDGPARCFHFIKSLIEPADAGLPVIGPFARGCSSSSCLCR